MKKQLFSFLMVLALVVLAGTSAMAQDGLTPSTPRLLVVGSQTQFTVAEAQGAATYQWNVYEVTQSGLAVDADLASATNPTTKYKFVNSDGTSSGASSTAASIYIKWLGAPADASIFVIQVRSTTDAVTGNSCSTIRRFYATLFNYEVDIYLSDASGNKVETAGAEVDDRLCNTWSSKVIYNGTTTDAFEGTDLTSPDADLYSLGGTSGTRKVTPTHITVEISVSGAAALNVSALNWRLKYSTPTFTDMSLYSMSTASRAKFSTIAGTSSITAVPETATLAIATTGIAAEGNNTIYIAAGGTATTSEKFTFELLTHNNLGAASMVYAFAVDEVNLALQGSGSGGTIVLADFNDGVKVNATGASADAATLTDARSSARTIDMSPATSVIDITD